MPSDRPEDDVVAEVAAVLDGSTIEVSQDGTTTVVHLLGVEAPGTQDCLGPEATATLTELLPVGTEVRLEREDDDAAAAVFVDDLLVNAEMARLGLALIVTDVPGPVADEIDGAVREAVRAEAGAFGTEVDCTVPAQVAALEETASAAAGAAASLSVGIGLEELDRQDAALAAVATSGAALAAVLAGDGARRYPSRLVDVLTARTAAVNERIGTVTSEVQAVRVAEQQRIEAERVEAERVAAEAAAQAAAAQAAAEAEAARVAAAAHEAAAKPAPAAGGGSVYYQNCDAVRAAGAAPILAGQPGYSSKLDRDGDGVGCEN